VGVIDVAALGPFLKQSQVKADDFILCNWFYIFLCEYNRKTCSILFMHCSIRTNFVLIRPG